MKTITALIMSTIACFASAGIYGYHYGIDGAKASEFSISKKNPLATGDYVEVWLDGKKQIYKSHHPSVACLGGRFLYEGVQQPGRCQQYNAFKPYFMSKQELDTLINAGLKLSK